MNKKDQFFLNFLKFSFCGEFILPPYNLKVDWDYMWDCALHQAIAGQYYVGLEKLRELLKDNGKKAEIENRINLPQKKQYISGIGRYLSETKRNELINNALINFTEYLKKNGIRFFVFKGQTVGSLYDRPEARASGDIDFYIAKEDFARGIKLIQRKLKIDDSGSAQHLEFQTDDVNFELHFRTTLFNLQINQDYWDNLVEEQFTRIYKIEDEAKWNYPFTLKVDGKDIPTFEPTLYAVYLFIHIYHHFMKEGIGLRQICDWMMYLRKMKNEIDQRRLKEILERLKYEDAYKAFGCILVDYLGLNENDFPYSLTAKDRKWTDKILKVIFWGGNFGKNKRFFPKAGVLHSIETGIRTLSHTIRFFCLSPRENMARFPNAIKLSFIKYSIKKRNYSFSE